MINTQRLIDNLCEFVKIPSETPDDQEFIAHLEKVFGKMEGAKTKKDAYGNLIVKFPAKNSSSKDSVGFCCHADTVKPGVGIKPVVDKQNGIIKSDGTTILGSDDKVGIAEIIEMLLCAKKHPPIEVIIVRCEETGCFGSINLDYSLVDSKMAYVMDSNGLDHIIVGGPSYVTLDVHYKGKPSHAGMAPEKGISSILAAAKAISKLRLGRIDNETTANVGVIQGGEVRNGVPEHTKINAECRSLDHEKTQKLADEMESIFKAAAKEVGTEIKVERKTVMKAYKLSPDEKVVKTVHKAMEKNNIKPDVQTIVGGTDATFLNFHGIPAAAISCAYYEHHSCNEHVKINEMETVVKVLIDVVESLA
ncbi:MAG: M20/M25/M40 family metallo-hydrolase [Pseudomonadota bacterium]